MRGFKNVVDWESPIVEDGQSRCPHCHHLTDRHVPLNPMGSLTEPDPNVLCCTDVDPDPEAWNTEAICDCIWQIGPQARWLALKARSIEIERN